MRASDPHHRVALAAGSVPAATARALVVAALFASGLVLALAHGAKSTPARLADDAPAYVYEVTDKGSASDLRLRRDPHRSDGRHGG